MKKILFFLTSLLVLNLAAADYQLSNIKLTLAHKKYKQAFDELKKHLELEGRKLAPGKGALEIIIGRAGDGKRLVAGESRWLYKNGKLYIWGNEKKNYSGTLFAVYGFLEDKLGVRWIFPGDDGIVAPKGTSVSFKENESYSRKPPFLWAWLRHGLWHGYHKVQNTVPAEWRITPAQQKQLMEDHRLHYLRHRHGRTMVLRYAHAFTKWPDRFEKSRPDYFGVGPYGKPFIPPNRKSAKLCLSNPAVIDQIIADWKAAGKRKYLNISPNDGTPGFCLCAKCMALDTRKPGENFYAHLTDRYLNFWNRVAKRAVKERPDVMVTTYVYSYYRHPPRREKIEYPDNMLCGLVPSLAEDSGALFAAWKKAGMKHCFLRPNDTHPASALIRGMEKRIFTKFQNSRKVFQLYGADYDGTLGIKARDLEHYIVSRMISAPEKSFDELFEEFCSAYGAAAPMVKEFYTSIRAAGVNMYFKSIGSARNRHVLDDSEVVTDNDLNYDAVIKKGLAILQKAPVDKLSPVEKRRLARLIFSVKQNILANDMIREGNLAAAGKKNKFNAAAKALWDFRAATVKEFPEHYPTILYRTEQRFWNMYQPFRSSNGGDGAKLQDLAAGWRNSFDAPSMQGWKARKAFKSITTKEASFDRYSIETKAVPKSEIVMFRNGVEVTPGAKYAISYDVKSPAKAGFRLRVVANGKTIANINGYAVNTSWKQITGNFTVPKGVSKVTFYIYIYNAPQGGYIDNVLLTRQ